MTFKRFIPAAASLAAATPALAHAGGHSLSGFSAGFVHPFTGLDHVLAMVSVGAFAALIGGRAFWAVPASFVVMLLVGGMLGLAGSVIPAVEMGIAASVVVLGGLVGWGRQWPLGSAMALVGVFAVFHGYAHGAEIPGDASALSYSLGFALATIALHGFGLAAGLSIPGQDRVARLSGAAVSAAGLWIVFH